MFQSHSLKATLQRELFALIQADEFKNVHGVAPGEIPVYRLKSNDPIVYRCAIAKQVSGNAEEFAHKIVGKFGQNGGFSATITRSPWLDFRLSDRALVTWLHEIIHLHSLPIENCAASDWNLYQYAHARCLSLLYSASRQGLIVLYPSEKCLHWQWYEPKIIPWLDSEASISQLRGQHSTENALIAAAIDLCDRAISQQKTDWEKQALQLSQKILACDRACRIWGQPLDLAIARLGRIAVAQRILSWILQEKLMIIPWLEC
ncbi:MAG: hypothetical protein AAGA60_21645 [Cyanobacteria bacterium P01_E01_bin.42]